MFYSRYFCLHLRYIAFKPDIQTLMLSSISFIVLKCSVSRQISRYPQADVKRTQNRVVQSLHQSHPVCCLAWQQLVELRLELECFAAFCSVPWMTACFAWGQAEIPCKRHSPELLHVPVEPAAKLLYLFQG